MTVRQACYEMGFGMIVASAAVFTAQGDSGSVWEHVVVTFVWMAVFEFLPEIA